MSTEPNLSGAERIVAERQRQIDVKGFSLEHDATHSTVQFIAAALTYLTQADFQVRYPHVPYDPQMALKILDEHGFPSSVWPWADEDWKASPDPVRNLEKAGALVAAAIDRIQSSSKESG